LGVGPNRRLIFKKKRRGEKEKGDIMGEKKKKKAFLTKEPGTKSLFSGGRGGCPNTSWNRKSAESGENAYQFRIMETITKEEAK